MFRLDADPIVNSVVNPLLAAKLSLGGLDRHVSKEKLNLVEFTAGLTAESRESSPEIVRRKFINAGSSRILSNDMPTTFSLNPLPHTVPACVTLLNIFPFETPAECSEW